MTLRDYLAIAARWWWAVLVGGLVAGIAAGLVTSRMDRVYEARAQILVNQVANQNAPTYNDILGSQSLTRTYAQLVTSTGNLARASDQLRDQSVESLKAKVRARALPETQLIEVLAEDRSPERAALVANTVARAFPGFVEQAQLAGTNADGSRPLNTVFVAEEARAPVAAARPNTTLNVVLGVVVGLILAAAAVALVEYLDDDIDAREDIESVDVPFLGSVTLASPPKGADKHAWRPTIIEADPRGPLAESYSQVQANLAFALSATESKVLLVTSPGQGEGKSTTAANLAEALAESSRRVLLIDGDLRKPDAHRYFSLPNGSGLTSTFLVDTQSLEAFLDRVNESLSVLTGGPVAPNPTELLSSRKLKQNLEALVRPFDIVIIDSPPILGLADASLWLPLVDGVLIVARKGRTRRGPLEEAIALVRSSRTPIVGVVLNGTSRRRAMAYRYGYEYGPGGTETG